MYQWRNPVLKDFFFVAYSRVRRWLNRSRARRAAEWVRVDATIRAAEAQMVGETASVMVKVREWRPVVLYEYQGENTTYFGKASGEIWCYEDQGALDAAESLIGATLPIRYDPSRPWKSLYLPQDGGPPQLNPAIPDANTGLVLFSLKK